MRRWLFRLGIGAVVFVVVLIIAAEVLLHTGFAANKVAAEIQAAAGAPVHVGSLDVGLSGSSVHDLQFLEDGASPGSPPWATISRVDADVSLTNLVRGNLAGGVVVLRRPALTFRLDRDNHLLTKLPSFAGPSHAWPEFQIKDGQVTFQREGQADTVFSGVSATVRKDGDHITLKGSANDPDWGQWTIAGDRPNADAPFQVTLHSDEVHASSDKLSRVPFVPAATWEQVSLNTETSVDMAFEFGGSNGGPALHYRIALAPKDTTVSVPSIDLTANGIAGKVVIEDGQITATDAHGSTAGGSIHVKKAVMDFRGDEWQLHFAVSGERLRLRDLPRKWGLPAWDGRLTGNADLTVALQNGKMRTSGGGKGVIEGFLAQKIDVKLTANQGGFKFDVSNAPGGSGFLPTKDRVIAQTDGIRRVDVISASDVPIASDVLTTSDIRLVSDVLSASPLMKSPATTESSANDSGGPKGRPSIARGGAQRNPWTAKREALGAPEGRPNLAGTRYGRPSGAWSSFAMANQGLRCAPPLAINGRPSGAESLSGEANHGLGCAPPLAISDRPSGAWSSFAMANQGLRCAPPLAINGRPSGAESVSGEVVQGLRCAPPLAIDDRPSGANSGVLGCDACSPIPGAAEAILTRLLATGLVTVQTTTPPAAGNSAQTIRINLGLSNVSLSELIQKLNLKLPIHIDGKLTFHVQATIPLSDAKDLKAYHATGTVDLPWGRIDELWLQQVKAQVTLENGVLRLDELSAHIPKTPPAAPPTKLLPGGSISGTASFGVAPVGDLSGNLKVADLPLGPLLKVLPGGDPTAAGTVDGQAQFHAPAAAIKDLSKWEGAGAFTGRDARIKNIPADKFTANLDLHNGAAKYKLTGETLGGTFDLDGQYPAPPDKPGEQGRLNVHNFDLARLAGVYRIEALRPLAGRLDLDARLGADLRNPSGDGQVTLSRLAWSGKTIADQIGGTIKLGGGTLRVDDLGGAVAGGLVRARIAYDIRYPERSSAQLTAQRLDAKTLLAPFTDSPPLDGPLDVRLFTRLGRQWTGTGQIVMGYGKMFGITVRDAQFPLGWDVAPGRRGELRLHDAGAQASRGRLSGQANLAWGDTARLEGQARFTALDLGELLSHYSDSHVVGGLLTGRVDLGGNNLRSVQDLTARLQAKLAQATPTQVPVFQQVMPMILPGVGSNVQFQSGEVSGRLAGGVFRIDRLSLIGDMARIYSEGSVTLQKRLDLNVIAYTNQLGVDPAVLQLMGVTLPAFGPIPLATLNQAISYLSNRTISLRVTGTLRAPSIQVNPVPFLTETAVRYFISQAGVPVPSSALQAPGP